MVATERDGERLDPGSGEEAVMVIRSDFSSLVFGSGLSRDGEGRGVLGAVGDIIEASERRKERTAGAGKWQGWWNVCLRLSS